MFTVNEDGTITVTRGDALFFCVAMEDDEGVGHNFQKNDVVRIKIFEKKRCERVARHKDFKVTADGESVQIYLSGEETKLGDIISKPKDYWYEIELNPDTNPQTIVGYDENGAKVLRLYPEGKDVLNARETGGNKG